MFCRFVGNAWCKGEELKHPDAGAENCCDPEHEVGERDGEKDEKPKPEEDVNFIIDHVYREDAETIKSYHTKFLSR